MTLISVNVGLPQRDGDRKTKTGIFKVPVLTAQVGEFGLSGDAVCNTKHHGGRDQALYLYAAEDYAWWSEELGRDLPPGTFGENLTTEGLDVTGLAVGDRLTVGRVEMEVTAPRIPCATLARRMEDATFVERYLAARRPGAYLRVLREGTLGAGEALQVISHEGERVGILELFDEFHHPRLEEAALRRLLAAPIAERARAQKERQLASLIAKGKGRTHA